MMSSQERFVALHVYRIRTRSSNQTQDEDLMVSVQLEFVEPTKGGLEGFTAKIELIIKEIQAQYLEDTLP